MNVRFRSHYEPFPAPLQDSPAAAPRAALLCALSSQVKLFATDSNRQCIQTVLGPTYGGPLNKVLVITQLGPTGPQQYAIYTTHEKVVGLIKLPLDGNPRKAMGLLAHPMEISSATTSFDGRSAPQRFDRTDPGGGGGGRRCMGSENSRTTPTTTSTTPSTPTIGRR